MNIFVYIIFYCILFLLAGIAGKLDSKKRNIVFGIICVAVWLFFGMRTKEVGYDTLSYLNKYNRMDYHLDYDGMEYLFYLLSRGCRMLGLPAGGYLLVLNAVVIGAGAAAYAIYFRQENTYLCMAYVGMFCMPYTILMNVNVVRQGMAVALLLLAVALLDLGKRKSAAVTAVLGCMFHYMGFLILAVFLVLFLVRKEKMLLGLSVTGIVAGLLLKLSGIGYLLVQIVTFEGIRERVTRYIDEPMTTGTWVKLLFYTAHIVLALIIIKKLDIGMNNLYKLALAIIVTSGLGCACVTITDRISISMDMLIPLLYLNPEVVGKVQMQYQEKGKKLYLSAIAAGFLLMYVLGSFWGPVKVNMGF